MTVTYTRDVLMLGGPLDGLVEEILGQTQAGQCVRFPIERPMTVVEKMDWALAGDHEGQRIPAMVRETVEYELVGADVAVFVGRS